jgi:hypothetical protein
MSALIQLTFDGAIVRNGHQIALRDLSQAMVGIQSAADRACIDVLYGNVWKHQRLRRQHHEIVEFIVGQPQNGSYLIDFVSDLGGLVVERLKKALAEPYAEAINDGHREIYTIGHQIASRRDAAERAKRLLQYEDLAGTKNSLITRTYGDRSINKEFSQMLNPIRRTPEGTMKLVMKASDDDVAETYQFDIDTAKRFSEIISSRQLGEPVVYEGFLRELDRGHYKLKNFKGKFINASNDKDIVIHIETESDFDLLHPFLKAEQRFKIIACPIIEFSSFDPTGGDIQFIDIYHG